MHKLVGARNKTEGAHLINLIRIFKMAHYFTTANANMSTTNLRVNKISVLLFLIFFHILSHAEDIPNSNAKGMKKVQGVVIGIKDVDLSLNESALSDSPIVNLVRSTISYFPVVDLIKGLFYSSDAEFKIYLIKINDVKTLEVASQQIFRKDDCVLVWYDGAMGDNPNLSNLGVAGIDSSNECV